MSKAQWSLHHGFITTHGFGTPDMDRSGMIQNPSGNAVGSGRVREDNGAPMGAIRQTGTGTVSGIDIDPNDKISDNIVKRDLTPGTGSNLGQSQVAGTSINRNTAPAARLGSFTSPRVASSGDRIGTAPSPNDTSEMSLSTPAAARTPRRRSSGGGSVNLGTAAAAMRTGGGGGLNLGGNLSVPGSSLRLPQASYPRTPDHGMSGSSRHSHGMSNCNYEK